MQAHLIQLDIAWEDKSTNHRHVRELLESAPVSPGDLIVLPELFDVGFTLNTNIAIDKNNSTLAFLQALANETHCTVHGSRAIQSPDRTKAYNCATVTSPQLDAPLCEYAKIHPFSYGRESESYIAGDQIKHYDWASKNNTLKVCPAICYDLRFPSLFRLGAKQGAQAFVYGANWPNARQTHWRILSMARAIENQAFVIAVNRTGNDPHLQYIGGSMVIDPKGEILGELKDEEAILSVPIDPQLVTTWRDTFPALRDMKLI